MHRSKLKAIRICESGAIVEHIDKPNLVEEVLADALVDLLRYHPT